jgi:hypothetical protein
VIAQGARRPCSALVVCSTQLGDDVLLRSSILIPLSSVVVPGTVLGYPRWVLNVTQCIIPQESYFWPLFFPQSSFANLLQIRSLGTPYSGTAGTRRSGAGIEILEEKRAEVVNECEQHVLICEKKRSIPGVPYCTVIRIVVSYSIPYVFW